MYLKILATALSAPVAFAALASDKPDLHGDIVALATVLLRERLMTDAEYAKASTRFIK